MTLPRRILWMKIAALLTWIFAVPLVLAMVWSPARALVTGFLDVAIWPVLDGAQVLRGAEANMLMAIVAGFSVAIATFVWMIAVHIMPRDAELGRRMVATAMGGWFVVDSFGSWAGGAGGNVLLNVGFAILFLVPALWPDRAEALARA